jgi:regulator of protease activity HflC (stomatin/prohibitin superfamily)
MLAGWVGRRAPEVFLSHVAPWSVGVRQDNFGGGLDPVDLPPGLHGGVPGLRLVHAVDMRGRLTLFGATLGEPGPLVAVAPPLDIRTTSNQTAQVDLALAWRIRPGAGHRVVEGALEGLLPSRVADRASKVLEVQLAALASEEWFDAERRARLTADIEPLLAAELEDLHVELIGLHLAKVRFPTEFERKLQEKQVSHQTALLFDATARVDQAQAEVGRLENQTAAEEQKLLAEWLRERGEKRALFDLEQAALAAETAAHIQRVQSEAEAAHQGALAEGQLAVSLAEGIGRRLRLEALDGPGGQVYLAREAASHLKVEEVWLDSRDPEVPSMLDLDELALLLFGGGATIPEQLAVID